MIKINNLTKIYQSKDKQVVAFDNINLDIGEGEIFGVIGPSGAGKSTLIRCLNLLEEPTAGEVIIDGQDITKLSTYKLREARKEMGMIFQRFNLLKSRTVADNVAFPLEIAGKTKREITIKVAELLELVGLADKANNYPSQLSGGQQQRVGIARALANDPKVLLCDEATSALDPETTHSILELLKKINDKLGITIVIITHEMEVIKEICTKVAVLDKGTIAEHGDVIDIFTNPQAEVTKRFIERVINANVPEELLSRVTVANPDKGRLVKVSFIGESAAKPMVSELVHNFAIDANILYGNIDKIQGTPFGTLIIELTCENPSIIEDGINYLVEELEVKVEVIENEGSVLSSN
ncbi:D-methionine transport system ATP-binding protein [Orenia metallireducens]|jgi:D-methionine transport system ATP-binding protein|uniref:D-methionine transport system ATP-binding protein n=1 Tax=Orenia metallireducens TaxID=1413210 RepID=A0A285GC25_9FIRM|nr:methionine ABC transporter ATP-binding protein [Orenia metallireducens]PRX32516.1 D-methionine transport system ATP-binding protein [Orenia metallireducens]SNY21015.1 D-methionine transport system ATP-binding protein [Orenia metallireducens]